MREIFKTLHLDMLSQVIVKGQNKMESLSTIQV